MGILYAISVILILVVFLLMKKSDERLNILGQIGLGIVLIFSLNVFEMYILNYFKIQLSLLNFSIFNFILTALMSTYFIKTKTTQKYTIEYLQLIGVVVLAMVVFAIGGLHYGYPMNIKYESGDAGVHYRGAQLFANDETLMNEKYDDIYNFRGFKPGSFVNSGMLMMVLENQYEEHEYYKIFQAFSLITLFLTGYMIYMLLLKISKGKIPILANLVSILCMLGYPLNGMIFGFEYMNMGVLIVITLLYFLWGYEKKQINMNFFIIILALLNFQMFMSYNFYLPFIYTAQFIYLWWLNFRETKKIVNINISLILFITLIIPCLLGIFYEFLPGFYYDNITTSLSISEIATNEVINGYTGEGYIYKNAYSNMILLIPLMLLVIYKERKDVNIIKMVLAVLLLYTALLTFGLYFDKVSQYYLAKNYFVLWIMMFIINFQGLLYLSEKLKYLPHILVGAYIIFIPIAINMAGDEKIANDFTITENNSMVEVYRMNNWLVQTVSNTLDQNEIDLLLYAKNNLDLSTNIEVVHLETPTVFSYNILESMNQFNELAPPAGGQKKILAKIAQPHILENADYIIIFKRGEYIYEKYNVDIDKYKNLEVVYENELGVIVKQ